MSDERSVDIDEVILSVSIWGGLFYFVTEFTLCQMSVLSLWFFVQRVVCNITVQHVADVLAVILSDVMFFLLENNQKYTFFAQDNKVNTHSLLRTIRFASSCCEFHLSYYIFCLLLAVHQPYRQRRWCCYDLLTPVTTSPNYTENNDSKE